MNHGKKKEKNIELTNEQKQIKEETASKVQILTQTFLEIRRGKQIVQNPLEYSTLVAKMCPDFPSVYNFRREQFKELFKTLESQKQYEIILDEINFTFSLLQHNPKSYPIWSHRQWLVLQSQEIEKIIKTPLTVVDKELILCTKMLLKDERNFHAWNYRNWLIKDVLKDEEKYIKKEIEYTSEKIKNNFSNFSAFHFRAKNLKRFYKAKEDQDEKERDEIIVYGMKKELWDEDFELVKNAIYIQPNEQGMWQYYLWMLNLVQPFGLIGCKIIDQNKDGKIFLELQFNQKISSIEGNILLEIQNNNQESLNLQNDNCNFSDKKIIYIDIDQQIKNINQFQINLLSNQDAIKSKIIQSENKGNIQEMVAQKMNFLGCNIFIEKVNDLYQINTIERNKDQIQRIQEIEGILNQEIEYLNEMMEEKTNKTCHFIRINKISILKLKLNSKLVMGINFSQEDVQILQECLQILEELKSMIPNQINFIEVYIRKISLLNEIIQLKIQQKQFDMNKINNIVDFETDELKVFI